MKYAKLLFALLVLLGASVPYAQSVGSDAPEFSMYHYEDKEFNTDTVYGSKVVCFIFGSIT